jgi:hypothetical protein
MVATVYHIEEEIQEKKQLLDDYDRVFGCLNRLLKLPGL